MDNGFKLYIDGLLVASDNAEGFTFRWEYGGSLSALALAPDVHYVAVALEDHGGATAFDMQITGSHAVPEPGTVTLIALGMSLAVLGRRRRRS